MRRPGSVLGAALGAAVLFGLALPAAGAAAEVSAQRLAELAREAPRSPAALRELRGVDRVDGRPVDLRAALGRSRGRELRRRLGTLRGPAARVPDVARARGSARGILAERRFRASEGPRPLGVPLDRVSTVADRVLRWLEGLLPGGGEEPRREPATPPPADRELYRGERLALVLIALPAVALVLVILVRLARRRGPAARRREDGDRDAVPETGPVSPPDALEREAEAAEAAGDLDRALRLRFQAGLLRLEAARALELRPSLTSGELRRRLRSGTFEDLSRTFDAVAYGGRDPEPPDVAAARRDWPRVVEEARPA